MNQQTPKMYLRNDLNNICMTYSLGKFQQYTRHLNRTVQPQTTVVNA